MSQLKKTTSVTNGSQTVLVMSYDATASIKANCIFMVDGSLVPYTVAANSTFNGTNTVVTLTGNFLGATSPTATGVFVTDLTYPDLIPTIAQGDVGTAAVFTAAMYRVQSLMSDVKNVSDTLKAPIQSPRFEGEIRLGTVTTLAQDVNSAYIGAGWYYDGVFKYAKTGNFAVRQMFDSSQGIFSWHMASPGSVDTAATFTKVMDVDAAGAIRALGPVFAQHLYSTSGEGVRLNNDNAYIGFWNGNSNQRAGYLQVPIAAPATLMIESGQDLRLGTSVTRMTIKANGNVLVGTEGDNGVDKLQVVGSVRIGAGSLKVTNDSTPYNIAAMFCSGSNDPNFRLFMRNGSSAARSPQATFGMEYDGGAFGGNVSTITGLSFNRGGGATDSTLAFMTNGLERGRFEPYGGLTVHNDLHVAGGIYGASSLAIDGEIYPAKTIVTGLGNGLSGIRGNGNVDEFTVDTNKVLSHYGLAWKNFSDYPGAPGAALTGFGGIKLYTSGAERVRLHANGNLLLGTSTDNGVDKLQVNGSANISGSLSVPTGNILVGGSVNPDNARILSESNGNQIAARYPGVATYYLSVAGNGSMVVHKDGMYRMVFAGNGNVGIGVTNPQHQLSLSATVGRKLALYESPDGLTSVGFGVDMNGGPYELSNFVASPSGGHAQFTWADLSSVTNVYTVRMKLASSGNLILGSLADNGIDKLQVNGSILGSNLHPYTQELSLDAIKRPGLYHYDGPIGGTRPPGGSSNFRTIEIGSDARYTQLAFPWDQSEAYFRRMQGTIFTGWNKFFHDGNSDNLSRPPASISPTNNGDLVIEATSNTEIKIKLKGTDGVVRSVSLTLS